MKRGEVWWAPVAAGVHRPHLILTRDPAIDLLRRVIVVPTTRTIRAIPTEVELDSSDGMPRSCVLTLDNLTLLDKRLLTRRICELGPERMQQACTALRIATGC